MPRTVASCTINYPLIWNQGQADIRVLGLILQVRYQRLWVQPGDNDLGGFQAAQNMEMLFDRHARVAYTRIEVEFPQQVEDVLVARVLVLEAVNRLISAYRIDLMNDHWREAYLEPLSDVDLLGVTMRTRLDDGSWANTFQVGQQFAGGLQLARIAQPSADALAALREGRDPPLPFLLIVEARRHFIYGNYRMAVVEANTAVEAIVLQAVGQYYRHIGRPENEIEALLDAGLKNLLAHHLPAACQGTAFVGTPIHADWLTAGYERRNAVVHEGATATQQEAFEATRACQRAVYWMAGHTQWLFAAPPPVV